MINNQKTITYIIFLYINIFHNNGILSKNTDGDKASIIQLKTRVHQQMPNTIQRFYQNPIIIFFLGALFGKISTWMFSKSNEQSIDLSSSNKEEQLALKSQSIELLNNVPKVDQCNSIDLPSSNKEEQLKLNEISNGLLNNAPQVDQTIKHLFKNINHTLNISYLDNNNKIKMIISYIRSLDESYKLNNGDQLSEIFTLLNNKILNQRDFLESLIKAEWYNYNIQNISQDFQEQMEFFFNVHKLQIEYYQQDGNNKLLWQKLIESMDGEYISNHTTKFINKCNDLLSNKTIKESDYFEILGKFCNYKIDNLFKDFDEQISFIKRSFKSSARCMYNNDIEEIWIVLMQSISITQRKENFTKLLPWFDDNKNYKMVLESVWLNCDVQEICKYNRNQLTTSMENTNTPEENINDCIQYIIDAHESNKGVGHKNKDLYRALIERLPLEFRTQHQEKFKEYLKKITTINQNNQRYILKIWNNQRLDNKQPYWFTSLINET